MTFRAHSASIPHFIHAKIVKNGHGAMFCTHVTPAPEPLELTFIVTSDPLQRRDVVVVLADGEGEDTDLFEKSELYSGASRRATKRHPGDDDDVM